MNCIKCNLPMKEYPWGFLCEACGEISKQKQTVKEDIWYTEAFQDFFSVIAHEYYNVRDLFQNNKVAGAFLQMKDLLEVILKFPVVVEMSYRYQKKNKTLSDYELLVLMLKQPLSMGSWRELLQKLIAANDETIFSKQYLQAVHEMFDKDYGFSDKKSDIVKWRNDKIGHGAYSIDDNKMIMDIEILLQVIKQHFLDYQRVYQQMDVVLTDESSTLKGYTQAKNFKNNDVNLSYRLKDGTAISLYPFLVIRKNQIFIFDSFIYSKNKYDLLAYPVAVKLEYKNDPMRKSIDKIYDECCSVLTDAKLFKDIVMENDLDMNHMLRQQEQAITEEKGKVQEVAYLNNWLREKINKSQKQKFLLLMQRGMGKTTWARSLAKKELLGDILVKTVTLNDTYCSKTSAILSKLNRVVNTNSEHKYVFEDSENRNIHLNADDLSKELADYLSYYQKLYQKAHIANKLLIIFDGIDEAGFGKERNIFEIISGMENIPDHVYFLFTGRTYDEMDTRYEQMIDALSLEDENVLSLDKEADCYVDVLKAFMKTYYGINAVNLQEDILLQCENNFAYLQLFMDMMAKQGISNINQSFSKKDIIHNYLDMLAHIYGEKYNHYLFYILHTLSVCSDPITIAELAYILGDNQITPTLLGYIHDIARLLNIERGDENNMFQLSSQEYIAAIKLYLQNNAASVIEEFEHGLINRMDSFENKSFSYLLANIKNFALTYQTLCDTDRFNEIFFHKMYDFSKDLIHEFSYNDTVRGYRILEEYEEVDFVPTELQPGDLTEEQREEIRLIITSTGRVMIKEQLAFMWSDIYQHNGIIDKLTKSAEYIIGVFKAQMAVSYIDLSDSIARTLEAYVIVMRQMESYYFCHNDLQSSLEINKELLNILDKIPFDLDTYKIEIYESMMRIYRSFINTNYEKENSTQQITLLQTKLEEINSKLEHSQKANNLADINSISVELAYNSSEFPLLLEKLNRIYEKVDKELDHCTYSKDKYRICEELELIVQVYLRIVGDHNSMNEDFVKNVEIVMIGKRIIDKLNAVSYKIKNETYYTYFYLSALTNGRCGRFEACMEDNRNLLKFLEKGYDIAQETEYNYNYIRYFAYEGIASMCQKINPPNYQEGYHQFLIAFEWFSKFSKVYQTGGMTLEGFDSCKNSFMNDVMNLLVAVDINAEDGELSNNLYNLLLNIGINKAVLDDARKSRRMSGTSVYVVADSANCRFLLCSGNQQPRRCEYNDKKRTLWLDFKRKCNSCIYKDCKGYRQSGTFEMRI